MENDIGAARGMTDTEMLDRLDRTVFVPAGGIDLVQFGMEELEPVSPDEVALLAVAANEIEPHGRP